MGKNEKKTEKIKKDKLRQWDRERKMGEGERKVEE